MKQRLLLLLCACHVLGFVGPARAPARGRALCAAPPEEKPRPRTLGKRVRNY